MSARHVDEALARLRDEPDTIVLAGGTDLMVEINFGRKRPERVVAIDRVDELKEVVTGARTRVGAGVTFSRLLESGGAGPALRQAARTVGSPQIRNAGTLGGSVATSSQAGD